MEGLLMTLVIGGLMCLAFWIVLRDAQARKTNLDAEEEEETTRQDIWDLLREITALRMDWSNADDFSRVLLAGEIASRYIRLYFLKIEWDRVDPLVPDDRVLWRQARSWATLAGLRKKHAFYGLDYGEEMKWLAYALQEYDVKVFEDFIADVERKSKAALAEELEIGGPLFSAVDSSADDLKVKLGQPFGLHFNHQEVLDEGKFFFYVGLWTSDGEEKPYIFDLQVLSNTDGEGMKTVGFIISLYDQDSEALSDEVVLISGRIPNLSEDPRLRDKKRIIPADALGAGEYLMVSGHAQASFSLVGAAYHEEGYFTELVLKVKVEETPNEEKEAEEQALKLEPPAGFQTGMTFESAGGL